MPLFELDDVVLNYERVGSGEPMLFIQGVGCAGCTWKPQTDRLQANFDCVRFDNRGIGQSRGATGQLTIEKMVNDAIGLLDALKIERAHIVGHSIVGGRSTRG